MNTSESAEAPIAGDAAAFGLSHDKDAAPLKRIIVGRPVACGDKAEYCAALMTGYSGSTIWLDTPFGEHGFSRSDGRWMLGPCLNLEHAKIHGFDELERSIKDGSSTLRFEWAPKGTVS